MLGLRIHFQEDWQSGNIYSLSKQESYQKRPTFHKRLLIPKQNSCNLPPSSGVSKYH